MDTVLYFSRDSWRTRANSKARLPAKQSTRSAYATWS